MKMSILCLHLVLQVFFAEKSLCCFHHIHKFIVALCFMGLFFYHFFWKQKISKFEDIWFMFSS